MKEIDATLHRRFTGGSLGQVQESLARVVEIVENSRIHSEAWPDHRPKSLWIRTPIIPGMTDRVENIAGIAEYLLSFGKDAFDRWELCAFNNLCGDKYRSLGLEWELGDAGLMTAKRMDKLVAAAVDAGIDDGLVGWNGRVRDGDV